MAKICPKCGESVPDYFFDEDGKKHYLQRRKYCLTCSPFGNHNTKKLEIGGDPRICIECKEPISSGQKKGRTCFKCFFNKRQKVVVEKVKEIVGDACWICGYNKTWKNICFHHVHPEEKKFGMTTRELMLKWERVFREMQKCIVVCYNCHGEIHDNLIKQDDIIKLWKKKWKSSNE